MNLSDAAKAALNGRSSRDVGREKITKALLWIYRWGWSSPAMINLVGGGNQRGLPSRLAAQKLIERTDTNVVREGVPGAILTLNNAGLDWVFEQTSGTDDEQYLHLSDYPSDPHPAPDYIKHGLGCQLLASRLVAADQQLVATDRELPRGPASKGAKVPDFIISNGKDRIAYELEYSRKNPHEYARGALAIIAALSKSSPLPEEYRVDRFMFCSMSDVLLNKWRSLLTENVAIPVYEQDASRHWKETGKTKHCPAWVEKQVTYLLLQKEAMKP